MRQPSIPPGVTDAGYCASSPSRAGDPRLLTDPSPGLRIVEEPSGQFEQYARVPIGYTVTEAFDEEGIAALLRGSQAESSPVVEPYWKDYDRYPDNRPTAWPARFDTSSWVVLAGYLGTRRVAGAVIITSDPQVDLLRHCDACALLWDLRVMPEARGWGIGSALLRTAEAQARHRGARSLRVETQQVNVPACRFYQRHGFHLERATSGAYADLPREIQLLWLKPFT